MMWLTKILYGGQSGEVVGSVMMWLAGDVLVDRV